MWIGNIGIGQYAPHRVAFNAPAWCICTVGCNSRQHFHIYIYENHGSMGVSMGNDWKNDSDGNHNSALDDETTSGEVFA